MKWPAPESASIAAGAISALGASVCCMLPLALVSIGFGGAWIAQLRSLERFYPVFVGVAIALSRTPSTAFICDPRRANLKPLAARRRGGASAVPRRSTTPTQFRRRRLRRPSAMPDFQLR
jgi:hypothetical protein